MQEVKAYTAAIGVKDRGWLADDLHRSASSIGGVGRRCDADDEARDRLEAKVLGSEVRSEQRCVASLR